MPDAEVEVSLAYHRTTLMEACHLLMESVGQAGERSTMILERKVFAVLLEIPRPRLTL
jgi:hypothetical protein